MPRYANAAVRQWNDHFLIEEVDENTLTVAYSSLVSRTDADDNVTFEPTFSVQDVLVRIDGELYTKSRTIHRDRPAAAAQSTSDFAEAS